MTAPLTPPDCDLRDFGFMPLDVVRLRQSDLVAFETPEAILAAILLWGASWHSVPASSLTDDDRTLAQQAGYGRAVSEWLKVKAGALRGFIRCRDGRLYHPVVAEKANEAWAGKLRQRHRTYLAAVRKHNERNPEDKRDAPAFDEWDQDGRPKDVKRGPNPRQPDLLDGPAPARAHARAYESDLNGASSVDAENMNGESHARQANMSRATDPEKQRDMASKGEGQGQGQGQKKETTDPRPRTGAKIVPKLDHSDLAVLMEAVSNAAGFRPTTAGVIARSLDMLKGWRDQGIDFDAVVIPTIRSVVASSDDPTSSLNRFNKRILLEHAKAQAATDRPYVAPVSPVLDPPDEDEQFRPVRAALLKALGPVRFAILANPVRMTHVPDRNAIRLSPDGFSANAIRDDGTLLAIAKRLGYERVW